MLVHMGAVCRYSGDGTDLRLHVLLATLGAAARCGAECQGARLLGKGRRWAACAVVMCLPKTFVCYDHCELYTALDA